ncbi:MAG: DMT family transporter [Tissierellia bacterium]|nr:DMT family transporter [Tissierellia bacterium]
MYNLLSLLTGVVIAVMIVINGQLTLIYGMVLSTVIIHIVGTIFSYLLCRVTKNAIKLDFKIPKWIYIGGAVGVLTTVFNNFAFGKISMTSIVALGLFGQSVTSLLIDNFGLFGMKRYPMKKSSIVGIIFASVGIMFMLDSSMGSALIAVILSFFAGVTVVVSRTINARLSSHIGEVQTSFMNHVVGLVVSIMLILIFGIGNTSNIEISRNIFIYIGGLFGVATVLLSNITVPKVPAFNLTLLIFIGQVFTGVVVDTIMKNDFAEATFVGGIIITIGILINTIMDYISTKKQV